MSRRASERTGVLPRDMFPVWRKRGASCPSFRGSGKDPRTFAEVVSDYSGLPGQSATPRTPTSRQRELMAPSALSGLPPKGAARINGDPYHGGQRPPGYAVLLVDLGDDARAHRAATLADGETQALVHRDRVDQRHRHLHVVAGHHHLDAFRKLHRARDVGRAEVELRAVALEERRVTATLVLRSEERRVG